MENNCPYHGILRTPLLNPLILGRLGWTAWAVVVLVLDWVLLLKLRKKRKYYFFLKNGLSSKNTIPLGRIMCNWLKFSRKFLQNFSNWLCCRESCALSKLNSKHQKSIADIKSQISNPILRINSYFWLFLLLISRKRKRNYATLRYWTFSSKGNVHKSSFGLCSRAPGPIKGSVAQKQKPHELLATLWFEKKLKFQLTFIDCN